MGKSSDPPYRKAGCEYGGLHHASGSHKHAAYLVLYGTFWSLEVLQFPHIEEQDENRDATAETFYHIPTCDMIHRSSPGLDR